MKKINEYIVAKEAAISAAADIPIENPGKQATGLGNAPKDAMHGTLDAPPKDAMHGAMDNTLQVDNPSAWVKTE